MHDHIMCAIPIRVLVIEKHPLMCEAVRAALESDPNVIVVEAGADVYVACKSKNVVDIVLLAIEYAGQENTDAVTALHARWPRACILGFVENVPGYEILARNAGVRLCLTKAASRDELLHTLHALAQEQQELLYDK